MTPRKAKVRQKTIATYGRHGQKVRVWRERDMVRVQSRSLGLTKSYRGDDAEDTARGFAQRLARGEIIAASSAPGTTIAALWEAYKRSSDFRNLRARSSVLYQDAWRLFTDVVPFRTPADEVTVAVMESVRTSCEDLPRERTKRPYAVNTIRKALSIVKGVFAWGERTEFLHRNRIHAFKFKVAKDKRPVTPAEYSQEEFQRLLGALSFDKTSQRTPYCVLSLCGYQGVRINAVLHLRWEDVDWAADAIWWRSQWDKMGNEWTQPLRAPTRAVLARFWESLDRPTSGWVFSARRKGAASETYTSASFWAALKAAEERVGIPHIPGRSAHGFRRMIAGDVTEATGSAVAAMHAIGDKDIKMADRYVKRRVGKVAQSLSSLDRKVSGE